MDAQRAHTLSRFWQRRIAMLEKTSAASPRMARRQRVLFGGLALLIVALPMLVFVPVSRLQAQGGGEKLKPSSPVNAADRVEKAADWIESPRVSEKAPLEKVSTKPTKPGTNQLDAESVQNRMGPPKVEFYPEPSESEKLIQEALEKQLETPFEAQDETLQRIIEQLTVRLKVPILPDKKALDEGGVSYDSPDFNLNIQDVSVANLLKLLLGQKDLAYLVEDGVLKIVTRHYLRNEIRMFIYPVADLCPTEMDLAELEVAVSDCKKREPEEFEGKAEGGGGGGGFGVINGASLHLVQHVQEVAKPLVGGHVRSNSATRTLIVNQDYESHEKVLKLLRSLRQVAAESGIRPSEGSAESNSMRRRRGFSSSD